MSQPSLGDKHLIRLTYVRSRIQVLAEKIQRPETPAVLAEQYLIEMNQLECEEAFLLDMLNQPPRTTSTLSDRSVNPLID